MSSIKAAASAAAGAAYAGGHVGFEVWPLLFLAFVPWWLSLEGARASHAGALGLVFGGALYAVGYGWLLPGLNELLAGDLSVACLLWLFYGVLFSACYSVVALSYTGMRRLGWGPVLSGLIPILVFEGLDPIPFLAPSGSALISSLPMAQLAEFGGAPLLSVLVAGINGGWVSAVLGFRRGERERAGMACLSIAVLLGCVWGYGTWRLGAVWTEGEASLDIAIVQANLGRHEKRVEAEVSHRAHLDQTRDLLREGTAPDLVVWPETAFARALRRPLPLDGQPVRAELTVPLLFGGTSLFEQEGRRVVANSAFLVDETGRIRKAYDKNQLIPMAESRPAGLEERWSSWFPNAQRFRAGTERSGLTLDGLRLATPICFEVLQSRYVREMVVAAEADLLVTLANDGWFGASRAASIHMSLARLRAIEHRIWLVRATNSGVSGFVDPAGRVTAQTALQTRATLRGTVWPQREATLYTRVGDWSTVLVVVAAGFDGLVRRRRKGVLTQA